MIVSWDCSYESFAEGSAGLRGAGSGQQPRSGGCPWRCWGGRRGILGGDEAKGGVTLKLPCLGPFFKFYVAISQLYVLRASSNLLEQGWDWPGWGQVGKEDEVHCAFAVEKVLLLAVGDGSDPEGGLLRPAST